MLPAWLKSLAKLFAEKLKPGELNRLLVNVEFFSDAQTQELLVESSTKIYPNNKQ